MLTWVPWFRLWIIFSSFISSFFFLSVPFVENTYCKQPPRHSSVIKTRYFQFLPCLGTLTVKKCYLTSKTYIDKLGLLQHPISPPCPQPNPTQISGYLLNQFKELIYSILEVSSPTLSWLQLTIYIISLLYIYMKFLVRKNSTEQKKKCTRNRLTFSPLFLYVNFSIWRWYSN